MKANLDFERISRVINELHGESREAINKTGPITEDDVVAMRLYSLFDKDPQYRALLLQLVSGAQIMPRECFACLMALGYRMGQEDAKATGEVAELENLFNKESK